jgi:hypothetical protein
MSLPAYFASAPPGAFAAWSALLAALASLTFAGGFVFLRRTRLMEDMPTSRLRSAAQGYIEVEGVARLMEGEPIICPLTATRCAWWEYSVDERQKDARGNSRWVKVRAETSDDCFLLDDGTGACVVDPSGAQVIPGIERTWFGYHPTPDIGPVAGKGWWRVMWCTFRYTERLILPANAVYALGAFRTQTGLADSFDEQADLRDLLAKWKHDPKMMAMFDVNKDGAVDQHEWDAARRAGLEQVRREQVSRAVATPDLNILGKPRDGRPFILSGVSQAALIQRYRGYAIAAIGGCTFLAGFFLWALRVRGVIG